MRGPISVIGKISKRHRGELPVQVEHQPDAGDQLHERQQRAVGEMLDRAFIGRHVDREAREDFAALGPGEERRRQVLHMIEQSCADVGDDVRRRARIPQFIPDGDDRGEDAGHRQHDQDAIERLQVLFVQRIVDQELQAQRHDDVEQRLDQQAEADDRKPLLVVLQERQREAIDGRKCARRLARGEDDQILVVVIVVDVGDRRLAVGARPRASPDRRISRQGSGLPSDSRESGCAASRYRAQHLARMEILAATPCNRITDED